LQLLCLHLQSGLALSIFVAAIKHHPSWFWSITSNGRRVLTSRKNARYVVHMVHLCSSRVDIVSIFLVFNRPQKIWYVLNVSRLFQRELKSIVSTVAKKVSRLNSSELRISEKRLVKERLYTTMSVRNRYEINAQLFKVNKDFDTLFLFTNHDLPIYVFWFTVHPWAL